MGVINLYFPLGHKSQGMAYSTAVRRGGGSTLILGKWVSICPCVGYGFQAFNHFTPDSAKTKIGRFSKNSTNWVK